MDAQTFEERELITLRKTFAKQSTHSYGREIYPDGSGSPLYAWLASRAAEDDEVLRLVLHANTRPQRANMLFAAVQYLLFSGVQDDLVTFYPNLTAKPRPLEEAYPYFRAFCLKHAAEIKQLVSRYGVQTNEVARCADLLLGFSRAARKGGNRPLALLELGSSAGLNMLWDHYGYDYGAAGYVGDRMSPVQLHCELRGANLPPLPEAIPVVSWRMGIDLNPIDVHDEGATRWLRALIWPEHQERAQRLEAALTLARRYPLTIVAGDAIDRLPEVLAQVPAEATLCIFHSYAMNQTPVPVRERIFAQIAEAAQTRELFRVSEEWYTEKPWAELELFWYRDGVVQHEKLAECQGHGRWLKFVLPPESL